METQLRATRYQPPGPCDLLEAQGGDVFQDRATPALRARGVDHESVPGSATGRTRVDPPELFGLGLVAAIPESTIRVRADPQDADRDGISGREGRGRFGMKEDHATLEDFVAGALRNELGLTTERYPDDGGPNGGPLPQGVDTAPDPEVSADQVALLATFVRFLAPPGSARPATAGAQDSVRRGRAVFQDTGCAGCHVPEMETGPSDVPALDRVSVPLYSDLLLHDLGEQLADVCGPDAGPSEFRTARLMGLRYRTRYLHDGRAATLEEAIGLHGGEAAAARDRFTRLSYPEKAYLIRFLETR